MITQTQELLHPPTGNFWNFSPEVTGWFYDTLDSTDLVEQWKATGRTYRRRISSSDYTEHKREIARTGKPAIATCNIPDIRPALNRYMYQDTEDAIYVWGSADPVPEPLQWNFPERGTRRLESVLHRYRSATGGL